MSHWASRTHSSPEKGATIQEASRSCVAENARVYGPVGQEQVYAGTARVGAGHPYAATEHRAQPRVADLDARTLHAGHVRWAAARPVPAAHPALLARPPNRRPGQPGLQRYGLHLPALLRLDGRPLRHAADRPGAD